MEQTLLKRTVIFVNDAVFSNGVRIPMIGFGTYHATDELGQSVLEEALRCGYRSFDTAVLYRNEEMLGAAIEASGVPRERLFLASKVPQNDLGYDRLLYHAEQSMRRMKTDYLDLYLIHWPAEERHSDAWRQLDRDTWRAMERLYDEGVLRAIGVSNFLPHHLLNLFASANIRPMANEIEFHPGYTQPYVTEFCRKNGIVLEGWSPIGRGRLLRLPLLQEMGARYGKSPAQLCIRFALQSGVLPLPKSSSRARMLENLDVFDFTLFEEDFSRLATLPQVGWSGKHPDFERWAPELEAENR